MFIQQIWKRTFVMEIDGKRSGSRRILPSVPQGSVLSPILYSIYPISDYKIPKCWTLALYANDTAIVASGKVLHAIVKNWIRASCILKNTN